MVTLHEVITFLISMQISISSLQTHNVNRCGRSRHLARKLSLRRKRSSPNVFEMAATETITSIILIKLIRDSLGTVSHSRRFKIVVIDSQITLKQMLRDFIGIRVNRAKKRGMVNITSSVNSRERSGINTILHDLNPLFTINVTMRDITSKNVYSRVNSKATTQWRKTQSAAFSSGKVRPNHETNINIIARRTGKDVNSHTVLDGIITTIMATIQRINIIGGREGSRNRRRLKANQTGKKFRVGIKSNISTNRNNLISGVDRCIHLNAMKKTTITSINRQTIKI